MRIDCIVNKVSFNYERHQRRLEHGHYTAEAKSDPDRDEYAGAIWWKLAQKAHLVLSQVHQMLQVAILDVACVKLDILTIIAVMRLSVDIMSRL